jgi:hypothetical protein
MPVGQPIKPTALLDGGPDLFSNTVSIALFVASVQLDCRVLTEIHILNVSDLKQQFQPPEVSSFSCAWKLFLKSRGTKLNPVKKNSMV